MFSSCLSRSITARLILDILNVKNDLYFGMIKNEKGEKIPHAWVTGKNNLDITPGISDKDKSVVLLKY